MLRVFAAAAITLAGMGSALASDVGLVGGTFAATYQQQDVGCQGLLITGQFIAPTPGYQLTLDKDAANSTATLLAMILTATPSGDIVAQVLTPTAVVHSDPLFSECPYGISISYDTQTIVVPLMPGTVARSDQ